MDSKAKVLGVVEEAQNHERSRPWALLARADIDPTVVQARRLAMLREQLDFAHQQRNVLQRPRQNRAAGVAVVVVDAASRRPALPEYSCAVPSCGHLADTRCDNCSVWVCDDHGRAPTMTAIGSRLTRQLSQHISSTLQDCRLPTACPPRQLSAPTVILPVLVILRLIQLQILPVQWQLLEPRAGKVKMAAKPC